MKLIFEHNIQEIQCDLVKLLLGFNQLPGGILNFTRINFRKFQRNEQEPNKFMLVNDNKEVKYCTVTRIDKYNRKVYFDISPLADIYNPRGYTIHGSTILMNAGRID